MEELNNKDIKLCGRCNKPKGELDGCCNCGRPTKYNEDILIKTKEYIDSCEDEVTSIKNGDGYKSKIKVKLPTIEGLCLAIDIRKETLFQWEKEDDKKEFSDLIDNLRQKQADRLINNSISGDYNPTIAKVLLTKHGYREGLETKTESNMNLTISKEDEEKVNRVIESL
jgi:hypothetical protein